MRMLLHLAMLEYMCVYSPGSICRTYWSACDCVYGSIYGVISVKMRKRLPVLQL